ncbi:MAG: Ig-like domain-containing protein [Oscillochloridaceae bacterium umkhey_bin13]
MSTERVLSSTHHRPARFALVLLMLLALAIQGFAVRPVQAQATQISVDATPSNLVSNGTDQSIVTVLVLDAADAPVAGVSIELDVIPPGFGSFDTLTGTTDANGEATFIYTAPNIGAGTVIIDAYVAPDYALFAQTTIRVDPDVPLADQIDVVATPSTIVGNGISSTTLTAEVFRQGSPLNDQTITFLTDLGVFNNGLQTIQVATGAGSNMASATLTSVRAGIANIDVLSFNNSALGETTVTITPAAVSTLVSASPDTLAANGIATSTISTTLRQANNVLFPTGSQVVFTTDLGLFANNTQIFTTTTNASGTATAALRSVEDGVATVTVTPTSGSTGTTPVTFTAVPRAVAVVAMPDTLPANNATTTTISATATLDGNPAVGQTIAFATNLGTLSAASATTDANGVATVTLRSAVAGVATVTATFGSAQDVVDVTFDPVAETLELVANPDEIRGNGSDIAVLSATVRSGTNQPVVGANVTFETSFGTILPVNATTDANGVAVANLIATSEVATTAEVTATLNSGTSATTMVDILPSITPDAPIIVTPAEGSAVAEFRPTIEGTVNTGAGSIVEVFVGNSLTELVCPPITVGADNSWSCTPDADFAEGPVLVRARVTDMQRNPPSSRASRNFIVDVTDPAAPVILSPTEGATTGLRPTIGGTAVGEAGSTVTVTSNGATLCTAVVANDGAWSCSLAADLPLGANTIVATVTDRAGNLSPEATRSFTVAVDTVTAPGFTSPLNVATGLPTIGGTADAGATVTLTLTLFDNSTVVYTTTASGEGTWSVNLATATPTSGALPAGGLTNGSYLLAAQAANSNGLTSTVTNAVLVVTIPLPPPVLNNKLYLPITIWFSSF